ncbi:MAG: hypothetical protein IJ419_14670 [Agathobacter sp.]|nr:hypothetical protein [Agathobacter sp.]
MIVRDLFNFIYPDVVERERILSNCLTEVEFVTETCIVLRLGFEKDKKISGLENEISDGYYYYQSLAHYDEDRFFFHPNLASAIQQYENEDIHEQYSFVIEKRLLRVLNNSIEQLKVDKWKD